MAPIGTLQAFFSSSPVENLSNNRMSSSYQNGLLAAMHGDSLHEKMAFRRFLTKNDAESRQTMTEYQSYWKKDAGDAEKPKQGMVNNYYDLVTDLFESGWGHCFHFCRFVPGEPFNQAIARHEHYLAATINLQKGMKVLDVGCGVAGPARQIAAFSECHVTGINNNAYQIERGRKLVKEYGLEDRVELVKGDFTKLPFPDNSFDAVYAIEAIVHVPTLATVYSEVYRVLKPGGLFANYEWVMTSKYRPKDALHTSIKHRIELGGSIPLIHTDAEAMEAMRTSGFEILRAEDMADKGDIVPWYQPLTPEWKYVSSLGEVLTILRSSTIGRVAMLILLKILVLLRLCSSSAFEAAKTIEHCALSCAEGGVHKIFTPMFLMVGRKKDNELGEEKKLAAKS